MVITSEVDERIAAVLREVQAWACKEMGFEKTPMRGDGELELKGVKPGTSRNTSNWRITLETRSVHGEGKVVVVSRTETKTKTSDVLVRARDEDEKAADLQMVQSVLRSLVRRITRV